MRLLLFWIVVGILLGSFDAAMASADHVVDKDGEIWFQEIKGLIERYQIKSTDQLLEKLPVELRSRHVLIFDSKSRQEASYQNPRVLLVSPSAKFILTFNGDPKQRGYESIETMRFTEAFGRPQFLFEEIAMEDDRAEREKLLSSDFRMMEIVELNQYRGGANAAVCLACHRQDPRPNWFHYPTWPGVYGQLDDRTLAKEERVIDDPITGKPRKIDNRQAAQELPTFVKSASERRRYKHLINLRDHTEVDAGYGRTKKELLIRFTHDLAQGNFARIAFLTRQAADPVRENALLLMVSSACELKELGLPTAGYDLSSRFSGLTYGRIAYVLQKSQLRWPDFFMDVLSGPGNKMTTPGFANDEFSFFMVKDEPDLSKYFNIYPHHPYGVGHRAQVLDRAKLCETLLKRAKY